MSPPTSDARLRVILGDCVAAMAAMSDESVDAIVTDPPAGISFMGRDWDSDRGGREQWTAWLASVMAEALRVCKPGAHALVWALPRTSHWTGAALEDAGWEVRDVVTHLFGSGFPKSLDVSKAIDRRLGVERTEIVGHKDSGLDKGSGNSVDFSESSGRDETGLIPITAPATAAAAAAAGWGTGLKPSAEFWFLARKPLDGTVAAAVLEHGTGALNIDGCRIEGPYEARVGGERVMDNLVYGKGLGVGNGPHGAGRWPPNVLLSHLVDCDGSGPDNTDVLCAPGCPVAQLNAASGESSSPAGTTAYRRSTDGTKYGGPYREGDRVEFENYGDAGGAARFFYVAKPRRREKVGGVVRNLHPCLAPESLVVTERGFREIAAVVEGDRVLADDGTFREVIAAFPAHCSGPIHRVEVEQTNLAVRATGNHPFLIWRPERRRRSIIGGTTGWVDARDVEVGDYTMTPISAVVTASDERDPEWWWMAGLWLAEGSFISNGNRSSRYPAFSLADHETDLVERLRRVFGDVKRYERDSHGITVAAFRPGVADELERLCGSGARTKVLDPDVLALDESRRRAFFDGYAAGDGCEVRGGIAVKTSSRALAPQLALLGESLGYRSCLYEFEDVRPRQIAGREIRANGPYYQIFFNDGPRLTRPRFVDHEGQRFSLRRVKKVTEEMYDGDVWNLTVEGAHTFQTAVGMTHNTVKPVDLMRWLVRLVTPPDGVVLDPFLGSGTTGCAAVLEGVRFVGVERDPESYATALARISDYAFASGLERPETS